MDWWRLAEPQPDGYDTDVALELMSAAGYVRSGRAAGVPTCFGGRVAIEHDGPFVPGSNAAAPSHPNIEKACELIRLWPAGYRQCQRLIESVGAYVDLSHTDDRVLGAASQIGKRGFGHINVTVNNHVGLAEGLVHELAHCKLQALGVDVESATRLIVNSPDRLCKSPVRHDCLRPVTAVLHAQYSYTYVLALDLAIVAAGLDAERDYHVIAGSIAKLLPMLEYGRDVLREEAELDGPGVDFMAALGNWHERLFADSHRVLERHQVTPMAFFHPLDHGAATPLEERLAALPFRPRPRPDLQAFEVSDEMVVFCPKSNAAFALNAASREIWLLCDGNRSIADIAFAVGEKLGFGSDTDTLRELARDVGQAIDQFRQDGLLQNAPESHG